MERLWKILEEIADWVGTPVYVYDEKTIQRQVVTLKNSINYFPMRILYAVKANFNPHILDILRSMNVGVDAVSPGEVKLAKRHGLFTMFTGNNVTDDEFAVVQESGVLINIDSLSALERFGKNYPHERIGIRINPNVGAGHHDHCITGGPDSKFGIWYSQLGEAKRIAKKHNLLITGIHQHIGSQILEVDKFLLAMEVLLKEATRFPDLGYINFGGGFGVPYKPEDKPLPIREIGEALTRRFSEFSKDRKSLITMMIEPGRYLVAESGFLMTRVNTIKHIPQGKTFVGVDSGFNHLIRPTMYGSYHPITNISNPHGKKCKVDVVGNICESGDKFATERQIAEPREGDLLAIGMAGAYGYSMSSNYNLRPRPPEVIIEADGSFFLSTARERINV